MKKNNIVKDKTYLFAIRMIRLNSFLNDKRKEFVLSKQILRSGTSIGALVREAEQAESKSDFIHKMSIALKEANETEYWISLLKDTDYIDKEMYDSLLTDCSEINKILITIIKTAKTRK